MHGSHNKIYEVEHWSIGRFEAERPALRSRRCGRGMKRTISLLKAYMFLVHRSQGEPVSSTNLDKKLKEELKDTRPCHDHENGAKASANTDPDLLAVPRSQSP